MTFICNLKVGCQPSNGRHGPEEAPPDDGLVVAEEVCQRELVLMLVCCRNHSLGLVIIAF